MLKYQKLFSQFRLGGAVLKNRIIMPAMDTSLCDAEGNVTPALVSYLERRARGGVGMIIVEFTSVDAPRGMGGNTQLKINDPHGIPGFRNISDTLHAYGTKVLVQLHHAGMRSVKVPGEPNVGPCDNPASDVHGLTPDEIHALTNRFAAAAQNAQAAGMDGVEIHAGHGYLVNQFLSPKTNTRSDEYGGSLEGRSRFLIEIIRAVRKTCGPKFIISVRLAAKDWDPDGLQINEGVKIAQLIDKESIDLINITTGLKYKYIGASETQDKPDGNRISLAKAIRPTVKTPIAIVGKIRTGEMCEQLLNDDTVDLICIGRQLICDPDWPNKLRMGKEAEVRRCLNCMEGCYGSIAAKRGVRCALNPNVGFESLYDDQNLPPVISPNKVVVIGGGIAGMQAAITSAARGNHVTLLEKEKTLGGQMNLACIPPHKELIKNAVDYFKGAMERAGVELKLGCEATVKNITALNPDVVILSSGSVPFVPPIPGIERAVECWNILSDPSVPSGQNITIIGGGNVGCETALHLLTHNNKITIIEMLPTLSNGQEASHRARDLEELENGGVKAYTSAQVKLVKENEVIFTDSTGNEITVADDLLIAATGQRPAGNELFAELEELGIRVERAGDSLGMGNLRTNVLSGFMIGYHS